MSLMLRLLMISTLSIGSLYADVDKPKLLDLNKKLQSGSMDKKALAFEKKRISKNHRIKLKDISIQIKKELPMKGWYGYVFDLTVEIKNKSQKGKEVKGKDIMFTNGEVAAAELFDINTGKSYKDMLNPNLSQRYYDKAHLIAGNANAKHKLVIFSDPLCPFCIEYVPEVIKDVKANPNDLALYYYHFPLLRIHPAADVLTKAMDVAAHKGVKDVVYKAYTAQFHKYFNSKEKDAAKILKAFNKALGTNITQAEINNPMIKAAIARDVHMGEDVLVQGTPTIFVDGEIDKSRYKYDKYIK